MEFISRLSAAATAESIVLDLIKSEDQSFDLGFLFLSHLNPKTIDEVLGALKKKMRIGAFLGCTCHGIIGGEEEIEREPAISLILGKLPGVKMTPFSLTQMTLEQLETSEDWYSFFEVYPNENPVFFVLPDPFAFDANCFLNGINKAYPKCSVIGGIASAASRPRENRLLMNEEQYAEGLVGVALSGGIGVDTIVSQGCRPIAETFIITKGYENVIQELAGRPLLEVLRDVLSRVPARDKLLAQEALFVGIAMDEYKHQFKRGDFLIRGLMGVDPKSGAGAVADYVKVGQTVQFHVRDAQAAKEDLEQLLKAHQTQRNHDNPKGALVFSCNGRGENLFRVKNHDIKIIQQYVGPVPAAGFFCAGEIGPVCQNNFLHGFTSSIALFYPRD